MTHPSFLVLDRVALGLPSAEHAAHIGSCETCQAHLARLQVGAPPPSVTPLWPRRWLPAGAALLAIAASLAFVVWSRTPDDAVRAKGTPSVVVWVRRGDTVTPWEGRPLAARDGVRFEVRPAGARHLTLFEGGSRRVLFETALDDAASVTTPAWELDDAETVVWVVLSEGPVTSSIIEACEAPTCCRRFELGPVSAP